MPYIDDNGTKWRALPADFPEWTTAYRFFRRWRNQGLVTVLHDRLRRATRIAEGRGPEPSAAVIDSQSLRAAETVAAADRGYDGGKRVNGTKRHIAVDVLGLLLTVLVIGAGVQDRDGAMPLLERPCAAGRLSLQRSPSTFAAETSNPSARANSFARTGPGAAATACHTGR